MIDWKERYMREVEGLNNEGDPIGGDPPSGLRHQVEMLKKMVIALENQNNDYLNQIRKAGLIVDANFVQGSVMNDIKPVAYMFDHTIQNDETSITIKDRAGIVNPLMMKIEGFSSVSNIRPLYPAAAYEAQAKRIAELEAVLRIAKSEIDEAFKSEGVLFGNDPLVCKKIEAVLEALEESKLRQKFADKSAWTKLLKANQDTKKDE